jgi:hypothetical protein
MSSNDGEIIIINFGYLVKSIYAILTLNFIRANKNIIFINLLKLCSVKIRNIGLYLYSVFIF